MDPDFKSPFPYPDPEPHHLQAEVDQLRAKNERLRAYNAELRSMLMECLADYSHPNFTDRRGQADRIRKVLGKQ